MLRISADAAECRSARPVGDSSRGIGAGLLRVFTQRVIGCRRAARERALHLRPRRRRSNLIDVSAASYRRTLRESRSPASRSKKHRALVLADARTARSNGWRAPDRLAGAEPLVPATPAARRVRPAAARSRPQCSPPERVRASTCARAGRAKRRPGAARAPRPPAADRRGRRAALARAAKASGSRACARRLRRPGRSAGARRRGRSSRCRRRARALADPRSSAR